MQVRIHRARSAQPLPRVAIVGVVAIVFLSSSLLAGIIAAVTITAVVIDMIAFARSEDAEAISPEATPRRITVDLSRRS
jgi:hypothetical protein